MHKTETIYDIMLFMNDQVHRLIILGSQYVVITHYEVHAHPWNVLPPFSKPLMLEVGTAVKKVADKDQFRRLEILDLLP